MLDSATGIVYFYLFPVYFSAARTRGCGDCGRIRISMGFVYSRSKTQAWCLPVLKCLYWTILLHH